MHLHRHASPICHACLVRSSICECQPPLRWGLIMGQVTRTAGSAMPRTETLFFYAMSPCTAGAGRAGHVGASREPAGHVCAAGRAPPVPQHAGGARRALCGARAPPGRAAHEHGRGRPGRCAAWRAALTPSPDPPSLAQCYPNHNPDLYIWFGSCAPPHAVRMGRLCMLLAYSAATTAAC